MLVSQCYGHITCLSLKQNICFVIANLKTHAFVKIQSTVLLLYLAKKRKKKGLAPFRANFIFAGCYNWEELQPTAAAVVVEKLSRNVDMNKSDRL